MGRSVCGSLNATCSDGIAGADMASEMIPEIYFDFLRGGPPEPLVPIFLHNQMDLRGLAALSSRIVSLLAEHDTEEKDGFELFGLSRICERRGETKRARKHYAQSLALAELPVESDRAAKRSLARLAKREGDLTLARDLWKGMLGSSREGLEAYEQLAIYYERHNPGAASGSGGFARRAGRTSKGETFEDHRNRHISEDAGAVRETAGQGRAKSWKFAAESNIGGIRCSSSRIE